MSKSKSLTDAADVVRYREHIEAAGDTFEAAQERLIDRIEGAGLASGLVSRRFSGRTGWFVEAYGYPLSMER